MVSRDLSGKRFGDLTAHVRATPTIGICKITDEEVELMTCLMAPGSAFANADTTPQPRLTNWSGAWLPIAVNASRQYAA